MDNAVEAAENAKRYVDVDVGHSYDGIRELDNRLPGWWLFTLYGAVVFAGLYWTWFQTLRAGPTQLEQLTAEKAEYAAAAEARMQAEIERTGQDPNSKEALAELASQPAAIERGAAIFKSTCVACHREDGGGLIGPNLTDEHFLHGREVDALFKVVSKGIVQKGMPAWQPVLGDKKVRDVVAFVFSLEGTNVANGKAPQGQKLGMLR